MVSSARKWFNYYMPTKTSFLIAHATQCEINKRRTTRAASRAAAIKAATSK